MNKCRFDLYDAAVRPPVKIGLVDRHWAEVDDQIALVRLNAAINCDN